MKIQPETTGVVAPCVNGEKRMPPMEMEEEMEITLEKIELVKDRTGVSYKEAKEALEAADGSVVDAIINIEESIDNSSKKTFGEQGSAVVDAVKDLVQKGNVSKIMVKKKDGEILLNLPVNAGLVATVIAPWGVLAGVIASFGFKCVVEVVKTDGTIIDVSDRANEAMGKAVEKGTEFADVAKQKSSEVYDKVKNSEAYEKVKDKAEDTFERTTEAIKSKIHKEDKDGKEEFAKDFVADEEEEEKTDNE
ncbi:MAG: DUF4342 domain-containing protein [Anaerovoracaceae bacterium]